MSKYVKNLFSLIIMVLCVCVLGGCASIDYSRTITSDGVITDRIVVEVSDEAMKRCTVSKRELYDTIKADFDTYYIEPIRQFKTEFWASEYSFEIKQQVSLGINFDVREVGNQIICDVTFANSQIFRYYYPFEATDNDPTNNRAQFVEGTFVGKYQRLSNNAFVVMRNENLKSMISKYKAMFGHLFNEGDLVLTQEYASPDLKQHSNAHDTEIADGLKMHHWKIDGNDLDFQIEFYEVVPNTGNWYILGLCCGLGTVVLIAYVLRRRKIKQLRD